MHRAAALVGQLLAFSRCKQTCAPKHSDMRDTSCGSDTVFSIDWWVKVTLNTQSDPVLTTYSATSGSWNRSDESVVNARDAMPSVRNQDSH